MSLGGFLFVVSAAWCIIHVSYYLCYIRHNSLLPLHGAVRQGSSLDSRVTVNGLQLRISTTKWNGYHDQLIAFFARRRNKETTALMKTVYNVGVILGALGMVSVILLCVSGLWQPLGNRMADDRRVNLFKRVIRDVDDYQASTRRQFTIVTPIVSELNDKQLELSVSPDTRSHRASKPSAYNDIRCFYIPSNSRSRSCSSRSCVSNPFYRKAPHK